MAVKVDMKTARLPDLYNALTVKQRIWLKEFIRNNGDSSAAVEMAYPEANEKTRRTLTGRNRNHPAVKKILTMMFEETFITRGQLLRVLYEEIFEGKYDTAAERQIRLRAVELAGKFMGEFDKKKIEDEKTVPLQIVMGTSAENRKALSDNTDEEDNTAPGSAEDSALG